MRERDREREREEGTADLNTYMALCHEITT